MSAPAARPRLGFLGLGSMGRPMAARLLAAGYDVAVWNRSPEPARDLAGATPCEDAADAFGRDVAISMLANDAAVRDVVDRALKAGAKPRIHVNMATISVTLAEELARSHGQAGIAYVAAPVFGRPEAAEAGQLNVLAAGDAAALAEIEPLLRVLGKAVWPLGERPAAANAVKIGGNLMIACAIEAMAEGSAISEAHGVSASRFLDIMTETLFGAIAYKGYAGLIAERRFEPPGFKLNLGLKDVNLALEAAGNSGLELPFGSALRQRFEDAIAGGLSNQDWSAIATLALDGHRSGA